MYTVEAFLNEANMVRIECMFYAFDKFSDMYRVNIWNFFNFKLRLSFC